MSSVSGSSQIHLIEALAVVVCSLHFPRDGPKYLPDLPPVEDPNSIILKEDISPLIDRVSIYVPICYVTK